MFIKKKMKNEHFQFWKNSFTEKKHHIILSNFLFTKKNLHEKNTLLRRVSSNAYRYFC